VSLDCAITHPILFLGIKKSSPRCTCDPLTTPAPILVIRQRYSWTETFFVPFFYFFSFLYLTRIGGVDYLHSPSTQLYVHRGPCAIEITNSRPRLRPFHYYIDCVPSGKQVAPPFYKVEKGGWKVQRVVSILTTAF
jgi:hypothetical protein